MSEFDTTATYDAIVLGGGFAGLIAARDLTDQGHSVVVLEARDRLGGRTWTRAFADTDLQVDIGGQWIEPQRQFNIVGEIERYGIPVGHSPEARSYPTLFAGERRPGPMPIPWEEITDLERAIMHCQRAAARIEPGVALDQQGLDDLDVSWSEFLAPLELPAATLDFLGAFTGLYAARYPEDCSALFILTTFRHLDLSPYLMWGVIDVRFEHGTKSLIDAIAGDVPDVRLETVVSKVEQRGDHVVVTTASGDTLTGRTAIVALPLNCWNDVEFDPPLSDAKREASAGRHGTTSSGKYFALTEDAIEYPFLIAGPRSTDGLVSISTEYEIDGNQVMVGFTCDPDSYELTTFEGVEKAVTTLSPGAKVLKVDHHDWNNDEFSKGDWFAPRPGLLAKSHSAVVRPEGRLYFAGSDLALGFMGWMEGAVESGHRAASVAMRALQREAVAATVQR